MLYRLYKQTDKARILVEVRSQSRLSYCTAKEMRTRYPDENFVIIGEIGGITRPQTNGDWLLAEGGKLIPILPRGCLKKPFEWIIGYIAVEKNTYVAVIGGFFYLFMYMRGTVKINLRI